MSLGTILLIVVMLMLIGVLPTWPHARSWGYGPSGVLGVVLLIILVLFLMGRLYSRAVTAECSAVLVGPVAKHLVRGSGTAQSDAPYVR